MRIQVQRTDHPDSSEPLRYILSLLVLCRESHLSPRVCLNVGPEKDVLKHDAGPFKDSPLICLIRLVQWKRNVSSQEGSQSLLQENTAHSLRESFHTCLGNQQAISDGNQTQGSLGKHILTWVHYPMPQLFWKGVDLELVIIANFDTARPTVLKKQGCLVSSGVSRDCLFSLNRSKQSCSSCSITRSPK